MRALISVSDKRGAVRLASELASMGWETVATGGTLAALRAEGLPARAVEELTGFPEICDGRVKTLHPAVHGALLARRSQASHMRELAENGIGTIDLVCVNLYPFARTLEREGATAEELVQKIDIGGPSMLRSAAKNYESVTAVCDPDDYDGVLEEIRVHGNTLPETRLRLAAKAFTHTAEYDVRIAEWMRSRTDLPPKLFLEYDLAQGLRYGENPHQRAAFWRRAEPVPYSVAFARQLQGKELSYNNIQDANAALGIVREFSEPFCVGLKHTNPCGAAVGTSAAEAWSRAYEADPVSIYGGIVAFNREVDEETASLLREVFLEIVCAPSFSAGALEILGRRKNLRLLEVSVQAGAPVPEQITGVAGGLLVQDSDPAAESLTEEMAVTKVRPDAAQMRDLQFAWRIAKHVKSNAIVVARDGRTAGVGAGQPNPVGSARIALREALAVERRSGGGAEASDRLPQGSVMASDGFFPFDDCVTLAARYGIGAIAQPGGSVRDADSVEAADREGIAMLFTGRRHFRH